ncbi:hypothetical protein ACT453_57050, partial [Bacillus sp. D-CC]
QDASNKMNPPSQPNASSKKPVKPAAVPAAFASAAMGFIVDAFGWDGGFILLLASCVLAMFFLALTLKTGAPKQKQA